MTLTPEITYWILLVVQAAHLLHHRVANKHISFTEVLSAMLLCVPASAAVPGVLLMGAHLALAAIQAVGSLWIDKLSPGCDGKTLYSNWG